MIIKNVCLLLEALSIVICLHHLYDERFRLDIVTVSFLSIDMIIMTAINYFKISRLPTMIIYPIIILYCGFKFGFQIKKVIVNTILCIVLVGIVQMLVTFSLCIFLNLHSVTDIDLMIIGSIGFLIIVFVMPKSNVKRLSIFLQNNERLLLIAIGLSIIAALLWLISFKRLRVMEAYQAIVLFCGIGFVLVLSAQLIKYKIRAKEVEMELKMHEIYSEPLQGLIDDIRLKQHEFDNHINAIYGLHASCHTFEELVAAQKKYCEHITKDNRFNKLIAQDNSVIRGFLYIKFVKIGKMGIDISYQVSIKELDIGMPIYKLVEIIGDLTNNAVEALATDTERNKLHVSIVEAKGFNLEVRNESPYVTYEMRSNFFEKGYSKKGENRGLGLYNVKQICDEYGFEVSTDYQEIDGSNWLIFKVRKES